MKRHTYHARERTQPLTLNWPLAGRAACSRRPPKTRQAVLQWLVDLLNRPK